MKLLLLFICVVLASSMSSDTTTLSVDKLLADGQKYNGKRIRVCGLLVDAIEYCGLSARAGEPDKDNPGLFDIPPSIWIDTPSGYCMPGKQDSMEGPGESSWAVIEGVFQTGDNYGHMGLSEQQITKSKIQLQSKSCN